MAIQHQTPLLTSDKDFQLIAQHLDLELVHV
jgi:hypothetical protein